MAYTENKIEEIQNWLKENLYEERYIHSIGVMEAAVELAQMFDMDILIFCRSSIVLTQ